MAVEKLHPDYEEHLALERFFSRKKWHCGGKIPDRLLYTPRNIEFLRVTNYTALLDFAFHVLDNHLKTKRLARTKLDGNNYHELVINISKECSKLGIGKSLSGGILLIYLELCENVYLPPGEELNEEEE